MVEKRGGTWTPPGTLSFTLWGGWLVPPGRELRCLARREAGSNPVVPKGVATGADKPSTPSLSRPSLRLAPT